MNELEKRSNLHKRKSKGLSYFTKLDAGDVPLGTEIFNKGTSADSSAEAADGALGEKINKPIKGVKGMPKVINIKESLNTIDKNNFNKYDLLNLYEACNMLQEDKKVLATLLAKNESVETIYKYLYKKSRSDTLTEARTAFKYKFYFCTGENARERRQGNDDLFTDTYKCTDNDEALECAAQDVSHMEWSEPFDDSEQSAEEYLDSIDFGSGAPFCYGIQNLDTREWVYGEDLVHSINESTDSDIKILVRKIKATYPDDRVFNNANALRITSYEDDLVKYYKISDIENYLKACDKAVKDFSDIDIDTLLDEVKYESAGVHHAFDVSDYKQFKATKNKQYEFTRKTESLDKDRIYTVRIKLSDADPNSGYFTVFVKGYDYGTDVKDTIKKHFNDPAVQFSPYNPIDWDDAYSFMKNNRDREIIDESACKKNLTEYRKDPLELVLEKVLEFLIEFKDIYEFPVGKYLASSWEDMLDGIKTGIDDTYETAESIEEYLSKAVQFNKKHPEALNDDPMLLAETELYDKLTQAMKVYLDKYKIDESADTNMQRRNKVAKYIEQRIRNYYMSDEEEFDGKITEANIYDIVDIIENAIFEHYEYMVPYIKYWSLGEDGADQLSDKGVDEDIADLLINENFPEELIYKKIKKFLNSKQVKNEKFEAETDKAYLKSAIDEMSRYVRNWSFMPLKDRRNISPEGISKLKKDLKSAESRLKQLSSASMKESLSDKLDTIAKEAIRMWYEDEMLDTTGISWRKLIERAGYDWDDFSYEDQQKLNKLLNKYDDKYIATNMKSAKTNDNVILDETGHEISDVTAAQRWLRNNINEYGNTAYFPPKIKNVLDKLIGIYGNTYFWH